MERVLAFFLGLPSLLVYAVLGVGAAVENVFPPIPADTFVLLGGFLAAQGGPNAWIVFLATWVGNVATALLVYRLGYRYGPSFFEIGVGRHLLNVHQAERMRGFYERWGLSAIFFARFLPGLRAVVPGTAGVSRIGWWRVAPPLALASAIWYGALVWLGTTAGSNLPRIEALVDRINTELLVVALVLCGLVAAWWWRTRRPPEPR